MGSLLLALLLQVNVIPPSPVPLLTIHIAFWNTRVERSGIPPRQTRIPDSPNQDAFTKRWLEFHQGYRIIQTPDGREERIAVSGEPLKDVDPGVMPRTLDELRAGRLTGTEVTPVADNPPALAEVDSGPSLDEALDQLLGEALTEEGQNEVEVETRNAAPNGTQPDLERAAPTPTPSMTAAELATLRHDIEQVRRQIEVEEREEEARQAAMATDADDMVQTQQRIEEYQQEADSLRRRMARFERYIVNEQAHSEAVEERMSGREEDIAQIEERLRVLRHQFRQHRRRAAGEGNFARVFGTREDIQSEDYVSPITDMFMRMNEWGRIQQAQMTIPQEPIIPLAQVDDSVRQANSGATFVPQPPDPRVARIIQRGEARVQRHEARVQRHEAIYRRTNIPQLEAYQPLAQQLWNLEHAQTGTTELSPLELHRASLGTPQSTNQIGTSTATVFPGGPMHATGAFRGTPTDWSGTDPEMSPSTNFAGTNPDPDLDEWLPADTSPEADLNDWLTVRGYVPNTRVRRTLPEPSPSTGGLSTPTTPLNLLSLPDLHLAALSPDRETRFTSSNEDESPRLTAHEERIRWEARQQFQEHHQDLRSMLSGGTNETGERRNDILEATIAAYTTERRHRFPTLTRAMHVPSTTPPPLGGLDIADERPEAKTDEEMMVKVECKICLSQVADTACLPCGHLSMCSWCADQAVPVKKEDRTRPARKGIKCPVCRENVKSRAKIFV